jgi:DegV family protein with EDD domain
VSYLDGIEITNEQFYEKLEQSEMLPTTSQVPPEVFADAFKKHLDAGDEVVGIFISSEISGTYNSACIAKEMLVSERLFIVDSRSATMSLALLVSEAVKCREKGLSADQIAKHITSLAKKVRFLAAINTLKYLRKGGRVSATTAVIGEVLGMKPIVSMVDGTVQSVAKARGTTAAIEKLLQMILADLPDSRYGVAFCHSLAPDLLDKVTERLKEPLKLTDWLTCSISSVIGTYSGKGVVGFAYIAQ